MTARALASLAFVTMLAPALAGCVARDGSTQITVAITSETEIPQELDQLEVVVTAADGSVVNNVVHDVSTPRILPATLAVIPRNDRSLGGPVRIEVRGLLNGTKTQIVRQAIVSYSEGRTLLLRMPLRMACLGFGECGADDTCAGGTCQPARVADGALSDYHDSEVFGNRAPSRCFDEAVCLDGASPVVVDAGACTFALPAAAAVNANLAVRWRDAENRIIVLDEGDPIEGWTRTSATGGLLSRGICESLRDKEPNADKRSVPEQALGLELSTRCPPKAVTQPFCPSASGQSGIGAQTP